MSNVASSVAEWLGCLTFFLKVGGSISPCHHLCQFGFPPAVFNLQHHQRPVALIPCLYGCGRLKIPLVGKSVGSGFLSSNCCQMVKRRLFILILDRQYKSSRKKKVKWKTGVNSLQSPPPPPHTHTQTSIKWSVFIRGRFL